MQSMADRAIGVGSRRASPADPRPEATSSLALVSSLEQLYVRSPVTVQNLMATAFGLRERALRYGGAFTTYCEKLESAQWLSPESLQDLAAARLRAMVAFSVEYVPHYRSQFAELGLMPSDIRSAADLAVLPVLSKETVRAHPERFQPARLRERVVTQSTGGTTGTPLRYQVSASAMQYNYAAYEVRFRRWAGVALGDRMASINGRKVVPVEQLDPPFWRHNLAFNQLYLSAYHLTEKNLPAYLDRLERYRPEVIVGYVSSIHLIADYIIRQGFEGRILPRSVMVSSETLFPWMRDDIEQAFGCPVFDGYGLGELTALITQCSHGGMHISPEYGVVESVEVDGENHLVSTGLFNKAMPLLRYDTGDLVEWADSSTTCPCGRGLPLVGKVLGRADDYILTPDGRFVGPAPLSLAFQSVSGIREAQIHQETPEAATVLLVVGDGFGTDQRLHLDGELRARLGNHIAIEYELVESIARTTWGKRRLVDSQVGRRTGERR